MTTPPVPPPPGSYPPPGVPPQGGHSQQAGLFYPGYPNPPASALPKNAYTSWITRVAAYFIDMVPVVVLIIAGQALVLATAVQSDCATDQPDQSYSLVCDPTPSTLGLLLLGAFWLAALAFWIWNYGFRQGTTGSSIGKSMMKFTVVSEATGQPIGLGLSLVRQLAHFLDQIVCNLGYLFPLWDAKRQTFADKIMSTVCVPTD